MTEPNELTLTLKGATISQLVNENGELTVIFKNVQSGEINFNGASHTLEGDITVASNIITDSKTTTGLKRLHDDGELVPNKGIYLHTVKLPIKFGIELPEAYLWLAPQGPVEKHCTFFPCYATFADMRIWIGNFDYYGRDGIRLKDRAAAARDEAYEQALYQYFKASADGRSRMPAKWAPPTIEILSGRAANDSGKIIENNLYDTRHKLPPGNTYSTRGNLSKIDTQIWSCTEAPGSPKQVLCVDFNEIIDGRIVPVNKRTYRTVRAICLSFEP